MHLTAEELIDLAEGTRAEAAAPHLQSCEVCRHQVAALRSAMSVVDEARGSAGSDVPEPSPLFWDHLSRRVHGAVAAEAAQGFRFAGWRWGTSLPGSWQTWAMAGVAAAVILSIYVTMPRTLTLPSGGRDIAAASSALQPFGAADDPSLALFADLTQQMDPRAITETGWSNHVGAVDEVVASLTAAERLELQRLLKEELAKS
jgi:hypothetical protein